MDEKNINKNPFKLDENKIQEFRESVEDLIASARSDKDIRMGTYALRDLANAISTLAPYKEHKKITIFGSARLDLKSKEYQETERLAHELAEAGFTIITGGGPGLMHAGLKGAAGNGVGIAIELPFETVNHETEILNGWPLARQQMFFTRKLALIRNVNGFVVAPGGFGTLDEFFEVLTLMQTGKSKPAPVVLFETPERPMWSELSEFIERRLIERKLVDSLDTSLFSVFSDVEKAVAYISNFWSNYSGVHIENDEVTLFFAKVPNQAFYDFFHSLRSTGVITEQSESALSFKFDLRHWCDLRLLIDSLNQNYVGALEEKNEHK